MNYIYPKIKSRKLSYTPKLVNFIGLETKSPIATFHSYKVFSVLVFRVRQLRLKVVENSVTQGHRIVCARPKFPYPEITRPFTESED